MGLEILQQNTPASETQPGVSRIATTAEIDAASSDSIVMSPQNFSESSHAQRDIVFELFLSDVSVAVGDGTAGALITSVLNGYNIVNVTAAVGDAKGITGSTDIQIRRKRAGVDVDVLSTKVTIGDEWFAEDGVINTSNDDLVTGDGLYADVDTIHSGTAQLGLTVTVTAQKP